MNGILLSAVTSRNMNSSKETPSPSSDSKYERDTQDDDPTFEKYPVGHNPHGVAGSRSKSAYPASHGTHVIIVGFQWCPGPEHVSSITLNRSAFSVSVSSELHENLPPLPTHSEISPDEMYGVNLV
jgi:hypothetical protein